MRLTRSILGTNGAPTLGRLVSRDGQFACVTLERPSDDPEHPCIPGGTEDAPALYPVHKATHHPDGPHPYECPELDTSALVPVRTHIQIHVGDKVADSLGCILTGQSFAGDVIDGNSQAAFDALMTYLSDAAWPWTLEIVNPPAEAV